jgi:uncharacterized protein YigE (DUF2233 family)
MLSKRHIFIIGILLIAVAGYPFLQASLRAARDQRAAASAWRQAGPGFEVRAFSRASGLGPARVLVVRVDPARCRIRVVHAGKNVSSSEATADKVCPPRGAAVNASFFAEEPFFKPIGLLICDGKKLQPRLRNADWGIFLVTKKRALVASSREALPAGILQAVESKPRLVLNGKMLRFKPQAEAKRAAVGVDAQGRVILAATEGLLSLEEWARCLREDLNCTNALNLDGGPSAQLTVKGKQSHTIKGGWPVPVFIVAEGR